MKKNTNRSILIVYLFIILLISPFTFFAQCWKSVLPGGSHVLAIKNDGELWGWGDNTFGQLGDSTTVSKTNPTFIRKLINVDTICAGDYHSVLLKKDSTIWAWGYNKYGQLGDGTNKTSLIPKKIGKDNDWVEISSRGINTLALKVNGTLWTWGSNRFGQLGIGNTNDSNIPIQIGKDTDWTHVYSGGEYCFAMKKDSTWWCWGNNIFGQLGLRDSLIRTIPTRCFLKTLYRDINTGVQHNLAISRDSSLWAWGLNSSGELGIDSFGGQFYIPQKVYSNDKWNNISTGVGHSTAIRSDRTLWAWGLNTSGQLGIGNKVNKSKPIQVGSDINWKYVVSRGEFNCALKIDGSIWVWGNLENTNLSSDSKYISSNIPQKIICYRSSQSKIACKSYKLPLGKRTYSVSGVYNDTLLTKQGCDSLVTTSLTIINTFNKSYKVLSVCNSYLSSSGKLYINSGVYQDTIKMPANACDSIITLNLIIRKTTSFTSIVTTCSNYIWNGIVYSTSGTYNKTLKNAAGCDSIATLKLTIKKSTSSTNTVTACDKYSWNGIVYSTSGTYTKTLINALGCDSIATLVLNILQKQKPNFDSTYHYCISSNNISLPLISENGISGVWLPKLDTTKSSEYLFIADKGQCVKEDTVYTFLKIDTLVFPLFSFQGEYCKNDNIMPLPNTSLNGIKGAWSPNLNSQESKSYLFFPDSGQCALSGSTYININEPNSKIVDSAGVLYTTQNNANYQWVDCSNNILKEIDGATQNNFTPELNGQYAVKITYKNCVNFLSECVDYNGIKSNIGIYPNPAHLVVSIELAEESDVWILAVTGQELAILKSQKKYNVDISTFSSGLYIVKTNDLKAKFVKY